MYHQLPNFEQQMRTALGLGERELFEAEQAHIGYSHASIGALVLAAWQLPVELYDAVRFHHSPAAAQAGRTEAALLHLADALSNRGELGALSADSTTMPAVDEVVWEVLGVDPESLDQAQILAEVNAVFSEAMRNL
jgi:HD-like signal output (HDOD) protein